MIRYMQAWKMSWHSRTASVVALCAALNVLAGILMVTSDHVQAQTVRPPQGTLVVKVPRGFLPSQEYWLYVNGQIANAPPYTPFAEMDGEFKHVGTMGDEYWDASGRAAASVDGHFIYIRPGLQKHIFQSQEPIRLAPGKYVVELLTRAADRQGFPFAVARTEAEVTVGKTAEVEFGIPPGTNEIKVVRASRCSVCSSSAHSPEKAMEFIEHDFKRTVQEYGETPIVAVLNEVLSNLSGPPPSQSSVFVNLPDSMGGGRTLDARQMRLIIQDLEINYLFPSIDENPGLRGAAASVPETAARISSQINEHNKSIYNLREIVKVMEKAKLQ